MAKALPEDGKLITLELSEDNAAVRADAPVNIHEASELFPSPNIDRCGEHSICQA
jgi:hypothetical protein